MTDVFEVSPEMQAAWCAFEPIGQFSETMSFARFNGMLRHAFLSGYMATSGMSAGTAKTPQAVEGEARQPGPEGETPKPLFSKDSPMTEQRVRELLAATGWTRLQTDYLPDDCDGQEEGWRIHDFPPNSHVAHWICGGLEEAEAKAFVALVNAALSTPFAESAKKSPSDSVREAAKFLLWQRDRGGPVADCDEAWDALRAALQSSEADNG